MTDYFELLELPRRPWLDPVAIKNKYHDLARQAQPDQNLNEAYRVISNPKLRLRHFLVLEDAPPADSADQVPDELADLFMQIAPVLNRRDSGARVDDLTARVARLADESLSELRLLDSRWPRERTEVLPCLETLYRRVSYLGRWRDLLEERQLERSI